jgi:hypothetical protein
MGWCFIGGMYMIGFFILDMCLLLGSRTDIKNVSLPAKIQLGAGFALIAAYIVYRLGV